MKSASAAIWEGLTPTQRASLFFVGEVDVAEFIGAINDRDEDEKDIEDAMQRAGVSGASWWLPRGPALIKKGLVKTEPYFGERSTTQIVLTPLGRRVVAHGKKLLLGPKKTAKQLAAEIDAMLAKEES